MPKSAKIPTRSAVWLAALLLIVVFLVHGRSLAVTFLSDDYDWVTTAETNLANGRLAEPLTTSTGGNFYRPLPLYTFMFDAAVAGRNPTWYHVHQLLIFWALCLSIAWLFYHLFPRPAFAAAAALLFAVYPAHHEVVTWLAGRPDLLATLFVVLSTTLCVSFARRPNCLSGIALTLTSALAYTSKESALILPAVHILALILARWSTPHGFRFRHLVFAIIPAVTMLALALYIRDQVLPNAIAGYSIGGDLRGLNIDWSRLTTPITSSAMLVNASFLRRFVGDWPIAQFTLQHYYTVRALIPIALIIILTWLVIRGGLRLWLPPLVFSIAWVFLTFIPVLGLSDAIGSNLEASRLFFLPSIGYAGIWAALVLLLFSSTAHPRRLAVGLAVTALIFTALSLFNLQPWLRASTGVQAITTELMSNRQSLLPPETTDIIIIGLPAKTYGAYQFLGKHIVRAVMNDAAGKPVRSFAVGKDRFIDSPFCDLSTPHQIVVLRWKSKRWSRDQALETLLGQKPASATYTWPSLGLPVINRRLTQSEANPPVYTMTVPSGGLILPNLPAIDGASFRALHVSLVSAHPDPAFGSSRTLLAWSETDRFSAAQQLSFSIPRGATNYTIPLCQYLNWMTARNIHALRFRPIQAGTFALERVSLSGQAP